MKKIKLTQGQFALVDDRDYEWLSQWKWYARKTYSSFYAARMASVKENIGKKMIHMHREILGISNLPNIIPDHIDNNGLNNQRHNLRIAGFSENMANRRSFKNSTSKYLGVSWYKESKKWRTTIQKNKKFKHIGLFNNETDAALAYNNAALKIHGQFAKLNKLEHG